jgi:hypothetical protein
MNPAEVAILTSYCRAGIVALTDGRSNPGYRGLVGPSPL